VQRRHRVWALDTTANTVEVRECKGNSGFCRFHRPNRHFHQFPSLAGPNNPLAFTRNKLPLGSWRTRSTCMEFERKNRPDPTTALKMVSFRTNVDRMRNFSSLPALRLLFPDFGNGA
jgi:hypothetical protein